MGPAVAAASEQTEGRSGEVRTVDPRERLVRHVQELERLEAAKQAASDNLKTAFETAAAHGFDTLTLKVVLKLRKMTPDQRRERRALEAIYMASLGMLEGDALPEAARRRLDEAARARPQKEKDKAATPPADGAAPAEPQAPPVPEQPPLALKDPDEARQEGVEAAAAGKRVYDNPYPAGDPCRAAWDEGWCASKRSHGMETPTAYQRRTDKPSKEKDDKDIGKDGDGADAEKGAQ